MLTAAKERIQQYSAISLESIRGRAAIQREKAIEQWRTVIPGMNRQGVLSFFLESAMGHASEETMGQVTLLDLAKSIRTQELLHRWGRMEAVMERIDAEVERRLLGAYAE